MHRRVRTAARGWWWAAARAVVGLLLSGGGCARVGFDEAGSGAGTGTLGALPFLPQAAAIVGTADLTVTGTTIDTSALTLGGAAPSAGIALDAWPQLPRGPELAVLHVGSLLVESDAVLRVVGRRPLVIMAQQVTVAGVIDASAHGDEPGPGGAAAGLGAGAGQPGISFSHFVSSGGGGGGFRTPGARGGQGDGEAAVGGQGGPRYGDDAVSVLLGGSGGGAGGATDCAPDPSGAGGGAIALFAQEAILVGPGRINAGGGGAPEPLACELNAHDAGGGGGSGGTIVLAAPRVDLYGVLAANGGGGAGGADGGAPAQDGQLARRAALGGTPSGWQSPGGAGGYADAAAEPGWESAAPGGGGGGCGAIKIMSSAPFVSDGVSSPDPVLDDCCD